MKFLPVAVVFALVVFSTAVPVMRDEENSEELSLNDVNEALESLDLLEVSAPESQLYFIKKIKRAIKRGVKIEARIRPASAEFDTLNEVNEALESLDLLEVSASESQLYFIKKIKRAIKRGVKIEARIRPASAEFDTLNDVNEALESLDLLEVSASESQLYFIKKIKRAIKRGVKVDVRIRPASAQFDTQAGLSFEEVRDLVEAYDNLEAMTSDTTYGFFKKVKKGLKKVGKIVEKGAKKLLERGVSVTVPI